MFQNLSCSQCVFLYCVWMFPQTKGMTDPLYYDNLIKYNIIIYTPHFWQTEKVSLTRILLIFFWEVHVFNHKRNVMIGTNLFSFTQIDMKFLCVINDGRISYVASQHDVDWQNVKNLPETMKYTIKSYFEFFIERERKHDVVSWGT